MKKLFLSLGIVLMAVLVSTAVFAATAKEAPETVTLDDCMAKKSAVTFPHAKHVEAKLECKTCHHTQADLVADSETVVETCASCHLEPEKAETPKCSEMSTKKNPFHIMCLGCHKDTVKADATKKAPTKCDDCHPKA